MSKFINPLTDYGWKLLFGKEANKAVLIGLLNDILEGEKVIEDLVFLDKEQQPEIRGRRMFVYDIYCRTNTGEHIIVEMQKDSQPFFKDRALFYTAAAIINQGRPGDDWQYKIDAVYGVFFLNFRLPDSRNEVRTNVILANRDTGEMFNDKFRQIFISLPNFKLQEDECKTNFQRWIYVLKNMETLNQVPFTDDIAVMRELKEIISVASMDPEKYDLYQASLKAYRDNLAVITYKVQEGRAEGIAEGMAKERKRSEARIKAAEVKQAKAQAEKVQLETQLLNTAGRLKASGFSIADIMQLTGLSRETIEQL
ncbi:MAG: Rpn family recombination-promoting nuclease/putative transposase [Prevotellaceae bacterium]|jgi:predicted transposase/invertase (TIGR01784 family)|nr:Rpn family recombination-promoting nuclease/putative transposase [Prevotellaceae bacterium]